MPEANGRRWGVGTPDLRDGRLLMPPKTAKVELRRCEGTTPLRPATGDRVAATKSRWRCPSIRKPKIVRSPAPRATSAWPGPMLQTVHREGRPHRRSPWRPRTRFGGRLSRPAGSAGCQSSTNWQSARSCRRPGSSPPAPHGSRPAGLLPLQGSWLGDRSRSAQVGHRRRLQAMSARHCHH